MNKKIISSVILISLFILFISYIPNIYQVIRNSGLITEEINIAGTGSMYPTFPKSGSPDDLTRSSQIVAWPKMHRYPTGINIFGYKLFQYNLTQGDIVEFENDKTNAISYEKYKNIAGFVKRAIALPGDIIELRDGFVKLNGVTLDEPYTAKPRSTFGGDFLPDCKKLKVPEGKVLVMGDNRKASLDSRFELGLIDYRDVQFVLPWKEQEEYRITWRDTKDDLSLAHTSTLNSDTFVKKLNDLRKDKKLKPLKLDFRLSDSGKIRGNAMIKNNDFSTEATRSGVTLARSVSLANYQNIIFAEVFTRGFYEADELIDNFLEFPQTKKILLSSEYQDIGIGTTLGEIDGCPVQVTVSHLGGYVPPNYSKAEVDSWEKLVNNLEEVLPSWRNLKQIDGINQQKVNDLLNILETRLNNANKILTKMKSNQWLSRDEQNMADMDSKLNDEAVKIMSEFNKR